MEAIGQLTGGIAHDFNNLLRVISSNLHLIERTAGNDDRTRARVTDALSTEYKGASLSGQLLAFSHKEPIDPRVFIVSRFSGAAREACGERSTHWRPTWPRNSASRLLCRIPASYCRAVLVDSGQSPSTPAVSSGRSSPLKT